MIEKIEEYEDLGIKTKEEAFVLGQAIVVSKVANLFEKALREKFSLEELAIEFTKEYTISKDLEK